MEMKELVQIGDVARQSGLSVHAIRYYEKQGLLKEPFRRPGGFRLYMPETVDQLKFIQKAQQLGLTLKEIRQILSCGDKGLGPCCDLTTSLFSAKIKELETRIHELQGMKRRLKKILGSWVKPAQRTVVKK